jgi:DNA-nicking Smr family endonuclease
MAKLSELRALLNTARKEAPARGASPARRVAQPLAREAQPSTDVDLEQVFADVRPLAPRNRVPRTHSQPVASAAQRLADEAAALAASRHGVEPSPAQWEAGQELEAEQTFLRKGLAHDLLVRLRRGHWAIQGELDLHRLTREQARDALASFFSEARAHGWRCVRVVHGKGLSSPSREPVLKGSVRGWLTQRDEVLAYCEAPRHSGGSGAVLVLLKSPGA